MPNIYQFSGLRDEDDETVTVMLHVRTPAGKIFLGADDHDDIRQDPNAATAIEAQLAAVITAYESA